MVKAGDRSCESPDSCLHKHMSWPWDSLTAQLLLNLCHHGRIALHDPGRDLSIPFPARIANDLPAVLFGIYYDLSNGIVVVSVDDLHRCAVATDCIYSPFACLLVHIYDTRMSQFLSRPCNASPMVSVCGACKGDITKQILHLFRDQIFVIHLAVIDIEPILDESIERKRAAEDLEAVQFQSRGFVLYPNSTDSEHFRKIG